MSKQAWVGLTILIIVMAGINGYLMNIYKLYHCDFSAPYRAEALRVVGVITPLGMVLGYLDLEE